MIFQINFLFDKLEQLEKKTDEIKEKILEKGSRYMKEIDIMTSMKALKIYCSFILIPKLINETYLPLICSNG